MVTSSTASNLGKLSGGLGSWLNNLVQHIGGTSVWVLCNVCKTIFNHCWLWESVWSCCAKAYHLKTDTPGNYGLVTDVLVAVTQFSTVVLSIRDLYDNSVVCRYKCQHKLKYKIDGYVMIGEEEYSEVSVHPVGEGTKQFSWIDRGLCRVVIDCSWPNVKGPHCWPKCASLFEWRSPLWVGLFAKTQATVAFTRGPSLWLKTIPLY